MLVMTTSIPLSRTQARSSRPARQFRMEGSRVTDLSTAADSKDSARVPAAGSTTAPCSRQRSVISGKKASNV